MSWGEKGETGGKREGRRIRTRRGGEGSQPVSVVAVWFLSLCGLRRSVVFVALWFLFRCGSCCCVLFVVVWFVLLCFLLLCGFRSCVVYGAARSLLLCIRYCIKITVDFSSRAFANMFLLLLI